MKKLLATILLFATFNAFADCPADPSTQCPALGSSLAGALQCHWKINLIAPADPLTQFYIAGTPIGPGPQIKDNLSYCVYASSDDNTPGYLTYALSGAASAHK